MRGIALDVDGVLTDGGFWWGPNGEEFKRFSFADVMGVSLARKAGMIVALVSGEDSPLVDRFAAKMGITDVAKNCKDKAAALEAIARRNGLEAADFAFMGDDHNDAGAMRVAGVAAAPANAHESVRRIASFVASRAGGNGAVREFVDAVLAAKALAAVAK